MNIIGSKLALMWERITFSRLTTTYFIFSITHCSIQVILQVQAFTINAHAARFLHSILKQGNAIDNNSFTVLGINDLRVCDHAPRTFSTSSCMVIWNGTALNDNTVSSGSSSSPAFKTAPVASASASTIDPSIFPISTHIFVQMPSQNTAPAATASKLDINVVDVRSVTKTIAVFTTSTVSSGNLQNDGDKRDQIAATMDDGRIQVKIDGLRYNNENVILDRTCLWVLNYPVAILSNTKREDVTFIAFQLWVLGMSTVAILNESIPHIVASLLTHMIACAWAGFQVAQTANFLAVFSRLTTNGACKPINLLPEYWMARRKAEIPTLTLNIAALLISTFLTWRLIKLFGWQTFKRVGASLRIHRLYMLVLILSITIQLCLFFMVVSLSLWIDQLWNGQIAKLATLAFVYKPVFVVVLILLIPWLMTGWVAVRRELRIPSLIFSVLSFGYLVGWGAMFTSTTFRWTFVQWRFFSLIASSSVILTLMAFILGLICRHNFGKGLLRYLSAQEPIPDECLPDPYTLQKSEYDPEKVDFPSHADSIPTLSAVFGLGEEVTQPNQMFTGRQKGLRFHNQSTKPFEQRTQAHITVVPPTHGRSPSSSSLDPECDVPHLLLARQDSTSSQRSASSADDRSETTTGPNIRRYGSMSSNSKRWVIE